MSLRRVFVWGSIQLAFLPPLSLWQCLTYRHLFLREQTVVMLGGGGGGGTSVC